MYKRQHGVHQVNGSGQHAKYAYRDAYGPFGSHADVFVLVLITDPVVQRYATHSDEHEHADEIHYDVLRKKKKKNCIRTVMGLLQQCFRCALAARRSRIGTTPYSCAYRCTCGPCGPKFIIPGDAAAAFTRIECSSLRKTHILLCHGLQYIIYCAFCVYIACAVQLCKSRQCRFNSPRTTHINHGGDTLVHTLILCCRYLQSAYKIAV